MTKEQIQKISAAINKHLEATGCPYLFSIMGEDGLVVGVFASDIETKFMTESITETVKRMAVGAKERQLM